MKTGNEELFVRTPVPEAILTLAVPTIISQLIHVFYNMADTFFVGQLGDPDQVAAATLCMPLFIFMTGIANLFGMGGASLVSRSLGAGEHDKARSAGAFSIWSVICFAVVYGIAIWFLRKPILYAIGCNDETFQYCYRYCFWTVCIGTLPTLFSSTLAHLLRAEGYSKEASLGLSMGGLLNVVLDPIFIHGLHLAIEGAAIATLIAHVISAIYFICCFYKKREHLTVILNPTSYTVRNQIPREIILVGLPSCVMSLMMTTSNITANRLISAFSNQAVAGIGIAKRIDSLLFAIPMGISQGVMPLVAYNYAAKKYTRMQSVVKHSAISSFIITSSCALVLFVFSSGFVRAFIDDSTTITYGSYYQRLICMPGPCIAISVAILTTFQATGKKIQPLILSMIRKGGADVPFMLLINALGYPQHVVLATPIADIASMIVALLLFRPFWRDLRIEQVTAQNVDIGGINNEFG